MTDAGKYFNIKLDDDDEVDENESELVDNFRTTPPAIVFCIDGRNTMFNDTETSHFLLSLQCIREVIRNHIFASIKCYFSVLITGCSKTDNAIKLKNIFTLSPLKHAGADIIKDINNLIEIVQDGKFESIYGHAEFSLSDTLWIATNILSQMKSKLDKKITIFTDEDDPFGDNRNERIRTIAKVADFEKGGITFQLMSMGDSFNVSKCYKEILQLAGDWNENETPSTSLKDMVAKCGMAKHRHVALANIPFYISEDFYIGVSVHYLAKDVKIPFKVKLCKTTNSLVKSKTVKYYKNTGEVVQGENIVQHERVCEKDVYFSPEEVQKINDRGERRMRLLGFKPRSTISLDHHIKPCAFIYPSDSETKGGSTLFTALLQRCHKKEVVAICTFCPRPTSSVRFVALLPQLEILGANNRQKVAPGFILVVLPFGDEVRNWEEFYSKKSASPEQVDIVKKVIRKMRFEYDPKSIPSPILAKHWAGIEALALDLPEVPLVPDETVPDSALIEKRLGDLPQRFRDEIYSPDYVPEQIIPKKKETIDLPIDIEAVEEMARSNTLEKLKVDDLKSYLKAVGLGNGLSKMKKKEVIEAIYNYLNIPL